MLTWSILVISTRPTIAIGKSAKDSRSAASTAPASQSQKEKTLFMAPNLLFQHRINTSTTSKPRPFAIPDQMNSSKI